MMQGKYLHLIVHVFTYVFATPSFLQSQFTEKGFKKTENSEQNVVLLLFLFTLKSDASFVLGFEGATLKYSQHY